MFKVKIVTKKANLESDLQTEDIIIPTDKGPVNLLPKHTHMIFIISLGIVRIQTQTELKKYYVTKGICKIFEEEITLLCDHCEGKKDIDVDKTQKDLDKYTKKLKYKNINRNDYESNYIKLKKCQFKLDVANT